MDLDFNFCRICLETEEDTKFARITDELSQKIATVLKFDSISGLICNSCEKDIGTMWNFFCHLSDANAYLKMGSDQEDASKEILNDNSVCEDREVIDLTNTPSTSSQEADLN